MPIILKIASIQRLAASGKQMQRVRLKTKSLYISLGMTIFFLVVYLVVWTVVDPWVEVYSHSLTDMVTPTGETVIGVADSCGSEQEIWQYIYQSFGVLPLLFLPA